MPVLRSEMRHPTDLLNIGIRVRKISGISCARGFNHNVHAAGHIRKSHGKHTRLIRVQVLDGDCHLHAGCGGIVGAHAKKVSNGWKGAAVRRSQFSSPRMV